jgi:hypothetical protein
LNRPQFSQALFSISIEPPAVCFLDIPLKVMLACRSGFRLRLQFPLQIPIQIPNGENSKSETRMTHDNYQRLAQQHRPTDDDTMAAAVKQMQVQGLKSRDIGQALGLDVEQIRRFMETTP